MKVTKDKTENSQAYLTVEMEPAEVEESLEKSYRDLVLKTRIPGFRKGKTPRAIFERYYGRQNLLEKAVEALVPEALEKAVKEQEIEPIATPQVEITQNEPLIFKAVVPLRPTVKLGDYRAIRIAEELAKEVTEKDVDDVVDALRHQHSTWEPVTRQVQSNDIATIDIESSVDDKPYITEKAGQYQAIAGASFPAPGFAEEIIGMKKGEEKEFALKFASDDRRTDLAGKEGKFKVKVDEIKQEILPEVNDDLAKQVSADFQTLAVLREKLNANLKARAVEEAKTAFEERVLETATSQAELEFPEVMVVNEIHRLIDQRFRTREQLDQYLKATSKTEEQLHDELHVELQPLATERLKRSLVLGKIAEEEKIEVDETEVDAEVERLLKSSNDEQGRVQAALNSAEVRSSIRQSILSKKTMELVLGIARGTAEAKNEEKEEAK